MPFVAVMWVQSLRPWTTAETLQLQAHIPLHEPVDTGIASFSLVSREKMQQEDLLVPNQLALADIQGRIQGEISSGTTTTGSVSLGKGSRTLGAVSLRGPAIICENCEIGPNVFIGPYTSVGNECKLKNVEIENSIVMNDCQIESGRRIVDSLIGGSSTIVDGERRVPKGHRFTLGERSFVQV